MVSKADVITGLVLVLVQCIFAGSAVITKAATDSGVDPIVFAVYRSLLGALVLVGFTGFKRNALMPPWLSTKFVENHGHEKTGKVIGSMFFLAVTGVLLKQPLLILGVQYTSAVTAALWKNMLPIITFIIALILGQDKLDVKTRSGVWRLIGIAAAVGGACVIILGGSGSEESTEPDSPAIDTLTDAPMATGKGGVGVTSWQVLLGDFWLLLNGICGALYNVQLKKVLNLKGVNARAVTLWIYLFGCVMLVPLAMLWCPPWDSHWILNETGLWAVLYCGFGTSALNYTLLTWATKRTTAVFVTSFWPVQILASMILSILFLGYTLTYVDVVGTVLVVSGVASTVMARKATEVPASPDTRPVEAEAETQGLLEEGRPVLGRHSSSSGSSNEGVGLASSSTTKASGKHDGDDWESDDEDAPLINNGDN
eukprot:Clim_evm4s54 gene=Clim_evmTU4s54